MNVVSFGGGTNSTAMIIGMYLHKIPIDLILFADTGGEQPHTYEFMETFNEWLVKHGIPKIVSVEYHDKDGNRLTLEQECINSGRLPSIAYGFKKCSMSHFDGLTEEPVEVLSMYDGMSCGHIALDKLGVDVTAYYATEIDKYAIQTTQHNFPDTVQLGDAFQVRDEEWRPRRAEEAE